METVIQKVQIVIKTPDHGVYESKVESLSESELISLMKISDELGNGKVASFTMSTEDEKSKSKIVFPKEVLVRSIITIKYLK